ncbi:hypothetical protein [uncultured Nostoc sp.]|uniref:hypothetical protein n=1 Tax=uncultured Nostoc sp. TaxID=340711 RepID=UPI002613D0E2|nr:hypothetical protein [uncultured Nostoc sp.]
MNSVNESLILVNESLNSVNESLNCVNESLILVNESLNSVNKSLRLCPAEYLSLRAKRSNRKDVGIAWLLYETLCDRSQ